jgi:hypothetical protein
MEGEDVVQSRGIWCTSSARQEGGQSEKDFAWELSEIYKVKRESA